MNAPTIASQQPEGLWQFIAAFWGSFEMQIFIGLLIAGLIGMMANFVVKWARKEITDNLWRYLFITDFQKTVLIYIGYVSAAVTAISVDMFVGENGGFVGWKAVLWFGLTTGFTADVLANKGETKVFTQAERIAVRKDIKAKAKGPKQ